LATRGGGEPQEPTAKGAKSSMKGGSAVDKPLRAQKKNGRIKNLQMLRKVRNGTNEGWAELGRNFRKEDVGKNERCVLNGREMKKRDSSYDRLMSI